jgi:hypothetical protein
MVPGRTLYLLSTTAFVILIIIWNMNERENMRLRGELLDKISAEAASNIKYLQSGKQDAAAKGVTDDTAQGIRNNGTSELDTRWLMNLGGLSVVKIKDSRKIEIKKLMSHIQTYNAEYAGADYDKPESDWQLSAKQQMIAEFNGLINVLKQARGHKNNLNF